MTLDELHNLIESADAQLDTGKLDDAEEMAAEAERCLIVLQSGVAEVPENTDERSVVTQVYKLRAQARNVLGWIGMIRGDSEAALEHTTAALSFSKIVGDKIGTAKALNRQGTIYFPLSDYTKCLECFAEALQIYESLSHRRGIASTCSKIGAVYTELSEYSRSVEYLNKAYALWLEEDNKSGTGDVLNNLGKVHKKLADYATALHYYEQSLSVIEEFGPLSALGTILGNIGSVYFELADHERALDYTTRALSHDEKIGERAAAARHLGNLGILHVTCKNYKRAIECFKQALALNEELGNKSLTASNFGNLGAVYEKLGEYAEAQSYIFRGLQIHEELGMTGEAIVLKANLGALYADLENPAHNDALAEEYLLVALAGIEKLETRRYDVYRILAELLERQKRWQEALYYHKKFHATEREVQNEEARRAAMLLEQRRQIADREKEIAIAQSIRDAKLQVTTSLLHRVLPPSIATRIIDGEAVIADYFQKISILFADIVGFTPMASNMQAGDVLSLLNYVFNAFDHIMELHGCQKIKTMGDGYMAVCGAPIPCDDHAEQLAKAALDLLSDIELPESLRSTLPKGSVFHLRIGLHCGPAFAGIVGEKGFVYDVYSDAVNLASRMESHGEPGKIHCSEDFKKHLGPRLHTLRFAERGEIEVKGKGMMRTYFLEK